MQMVGDYFLTHICSKQNLLRYGTLSPRTKCLWAINAPRFLGGLDEKWEVVALEKNEIQILIGHKKVWNVSNV